jgi:hypothetical protein
MIHHIDALLIQLFRVSDIPIVGYLAGCFLLSIGCVVIGQLTYGLVWKCNRRWLRRDSHGMIDMHNLSLKALSFRDKSAYKACNKEANDAFGKYFFTQIAMGLASLWPVPFALAWMDMRFGSVDFPLPLALPGFGQAVGFTASFIPMFILTSILFSKAKHRLPFFAGLARQIEEEKAAAPSMMTLADIAPAGQQSTA